MIEYIKGLNGDRVIINGTSYYIGLNCSYNLKYEGWAKKDYEDSIKYNWSSRYCLKPFIGRILDAEEPNWYEQEWVGRNVYSNTELTLEELKEIKDRIREEFEKISK
jgi:hypothetical protein